ncbi:hypothetical protein HPB50_018905 [Hyalomma asiaticum]|uniref:Uncharacterized protein n=1 Tax=Hyalomma asiaticum TaxID=266040 RepID=A0ACB7SNT8_HYAAI|nr:hypothetical protein HPB50_018905 [Hyalomma asiaticum]
MNRASDTKKPCVSIVAPLTRDRQRRRSGACNLSGCPPLRRRTTTDQQPPPPSPRAALCDSGRRCAPSERPPRSSFFPGRDFESRQGPPPSVRKTRSPRWPMRRGSPCAGALSDSVGMAAGRRLSSLFFGEAGVGAPWRSAASTCCSLLAAAARC